MNRYLLFTILLSVMTVAVHGQVPQFSSSEYAGWIYNNTAVYLNTDNILANKVVLYKTSTGVDLTLTSPEFYCSAGKTIEMEVTWITDQWQDEQFDMSRVALTAALLDVNGVAVDSVTYEFSSIQKTNYVNLSIDIPQGLSRARLRFASWKADVNSNGAVRRIKAVSSLIGDVNLDGEVTVADVNLILAVILGANQDSAVMGRADVNRDGEVGIADVNLVIDLILN